MAKLIETGYMQIRNPIAAGRFYEADESACRASLSRCIPQAVEREDQPQRIVAGIVPHAGWLFSGSVAGQVFRAIAQQGQPEIFVLFGAMHRSMGQSGMMFARGLWKTPLGDVSVDDRLAERIAGGTNLVESNPHVHANEHSLEVVLPFIQQLFPSAKILPIAVPPIRQACQIGQAVGRILAAENSPAICIGSTDLTHYGLAYGFSPQGPGKAGIDWAKKVNDQRIIELMLQMQGDEIVAQAQTNANACGAGAAAATVGAAEQMGAAKGVLLSHISSAEVAERLWGEDSSDAVGYAGIVFG